MKKIIALSMLTFIFVSSYASLSQIDEAVDKTDIEWVKQILNERPITAKEKEDLLKIVKNAVKYRKNKTKSLLNSYPDLFKLLVGLGINGASLPLVAFGGLALIGSRHHKFEAAIIFGFGSLMWLSGFLLTKSGWKLTNAYKKLNNAREIEKLINELSNTVK